MFCLLYTSDAADERSSVDLGGRRIIKKKKKKKIFFFFFQAEDGIRDAQESRGLGDVYKRQPTHIPDRPNQFLNTLDLCFTTSPSLYKYTTFAPIGKCDHKLISLNFNNFF